MGVGGINQGQDVSSIVGDSQKTKVGVEKHQGGQGGATFHGRRISEASPVQYIEHEELNGKLKTKGLDEYKIKTPHTRISNQLPNRKHVYSREGSRSNNALASDTPSMRAKDEVKYTVDNPQRAVNKQRTNAQRSSSDLRKKPATTQKTYISDKTVKGKKLKDGELNKELSHKQEKHGVVRYFLSRIQSFFGGLFAKVKPTRTKIVPEQAKKQSVPRKESISKRVINKSKKIDSIKQDDIKPKPKPETIKYEKSNVTNLKIVRSKQSVVAQVIASNEQKQKRQIRQTSLQPEMRNGEMVVSSTEFLYPVPQGCRCIGIKGLEGMEFGFTKFDVGVNERVVMLQNHKKALAHRDGRYIILNENEVVKGFEDKYYGMVGNGGVEIGKPDSIFVNYDGVNFPFPSDSGELVIPHNGKYKLLCINGEVKDLVKGKTISGFFDKAYDLNSEGKLLIVPIEKHEALQVSVDGLSTVKTPVEARVCLTKLFESINGKELFSGNTCPVSKQSTLEFIEQYRNAIELEGKWKTEQNPRHKKQQESKTRKRLQAIDEVKSYVRGLSETDEQVEGKCRSALQMLGRIRERSLVRQKELQYCGGFAVLQAAWGRDPLKMTHTIIKLLSSKTQSVDLDTREPGYKKTFSLSENYKSHEHSEAACDSMLIASLYDLKNKSGSTAPEDALKASYLDVPVMLIKNKKNDVTVDEFNDKVLNELCQASKQKVTFSVSVDGNMSHYLKSTLPDKFTRKNKDGFHNIEKDLSRHTEESGPHAVKIDKIERSELNGTKMVNLKLHTWGVMHHLQMEESTFLKHCNMDSVYLVNAENNDEYSCFKKLDDVVCYNSGENGYVESANGKEYRLKEGESVTVGDNEYTFEGRKQGWTTKYTLKK